MTSTDNKFKVGDNVTIGIRKLITKMIIDIFEKQTNYNEFFEYEYAVSKGEGTLVDYGVIDLNGLMIYLDCLSDDHTLIVSPSDSFNCETGR